jgi:hypothetical protein
MDNWDVVRRRGMERAHTLHIDKSKASAASHSVSLDFRKQLSMEPLYIAHAHDL